MIVELQLIRGNSEEL